MSRTMVATDECGDLLTEYLEGGDLDPFGGDDPWSGIDGGVETITNAFAAVSDKVSDYPSEDVAVSAVKLGKLVGASDLSASDKGCIRIYMELARPDNVKNYSIGLAVAADSFGTGGGRSSKSKAPKPADARRIKNETGMDWVESSAGALAMAMFKVPTRDGLDAWGHGGDPIEHEAFKLRRKLGQKTYLDYLTKGDAVELRDKLKKAARQLQRENFMTASATLVAFVDELSELTMEQGRNDLFIDYFAEHMEELRHRFLVRDAPLDAAILRRKVLCRRDVTRQESANPSPARGGAAAAGGGTDREAAREAQLDELIKEQKRAQSQIASLNDRISKMGKDDITERAQKPGPANLCFECGSPDHFGYNCPVRKKKKEEDEEKKKQLG